MLIITACLAGVLLGLNFNVAVLLPLAVAGGGIHALAYAAPGPAAIGTDMFVLTFSLQAGYMIGLTGRATFAQILTRLNIAPSKQVWRENLRVVNRAPAGRKATAFLIALIRIWSK
jgi:hypothetical protein